MAHREILTVQTLLFHAPVGTHLVTNCGFGGYIGAEATLSFLGLGLQPPVISWGTMIDQAQKFLRVSPHMLFFPAMFLSIAVLSFIMLGDAVREALDPKLR